MRKIPLGISEKYSSYFVRLCVVRIWFSTRISENSSVSIMKPRFVVIDSSPKPSEEWYGGNLSFIGNISRLNLGVRRFAVFTRRAFWCVVNSQIALLYHFIVRFITFRKKLFNFFVSSVSYNAYVEKKIVCFVVGSVYNIVVPIKLVFEVVYDFRVWVYLLIFFIFSS